MSRSLKKNPFAGITTAKSEKQDKRFANRHVRRTNKCLLTLTNNEEHLLARRKMSNVWSMSKDGKARFDPERHPKLLRK